MNGWPIGLSTGCFYQRPILDILEPIREAGFSMIEICSFPRHLDYHDMEACRLAGRRITALGLEPYSFHAPFAPQIDITAFDPEVRRRSHDEITAAAEAAAVLGVRHFVIHPGPEMSGLPRSERLDRMEAAAALLNRIALRCRELGVRLVLENMLPHLFSGAVRDLLWLLGALETTDVGICLDTGHAFLSGDLHHVAHKLSGHLWMLHASDNRGVYDDHLPPGDGALPWPALLRQLQEIGFEGGVVLEIAGDGAVGETLERAVRGRRFLEELGAERRIESPA
jgi:sugar phosphate isomerase/epimerase